VANPAPGAQAKPATPVVHVREAQHLGSRDAGGVRVAGMTRCGAGSAPSTGCS
jgi:hypothetical protein